MIELIVAVVVALVLSFYGGVRYGRRGASIGAMPALPAIPELVMAAGTVPSKCGSTTRRKLDDETRTRLAE